MVAYIIPIHNAQRKRVTNISRDDTSCKGSDHYRALKKQNNKDVAVWRLYVTMLLHCDVELYFISYGRQNMVES